VPVGSIIKDAETGEVLADLVNEGDQFVAAKGGDGGRGNCHFATAHNRAPRISEKGWEGEERWLLIELKLMADIGLVGLPNAGKSTLLSKLSAANPKVADYPFTTLEPQLGVLNFEYHPPCIIADIPGLIEGAHEGAGLGHKFLRHIERTRILIHLVDASAPGEEPMRQYEILENELRCFNEELIGREQLVLLNKIDLVDDEAVLAEVLAWFKAKDLKVMVVSAKNGDGLEDLKELLAEMLEE
ncbi:MAG: GTPase ObgE, partial [Desulfobulbaceae bacterium]|nr:GTPase ObgE [Desulfobulbaceae bacterium]